MDEERAITIEMDNLRAAQFASFDGLFTNVASIEALPTREDVEEKKEEKYFMVFREENISINDDTVLEDEYGDCIRLHIIEQKEQGFHKEMIIFDDVEIEEVADVYDYDFDEVDFILRLISDGHRDMYVQNPDWIDLYVKGCSDFDETDAYIDIPLEYYNNIKRCLLEFNCKIIEDTTKVQKAEQEMSQISYKFNNVVLEEEIDQMISLVDLDTFNNIVRARIVKDGDKEKASKITKAWAKNYLRQWAYSKYRFYKLFGDKLTIEKDVEVSLTENEASTILKELGGKFPLYYYTFERISPITIVEDTIKTETKGYINSRFWQDPRVKNNMSFTKFISLFGNEELNIEVSKIYQNNGKAHLTVSINPIDYLTVSINSSGWRSCHNFIDGEYRNAGLSYMLDETSIVAYRSNGLVDYKIEGKKFNWNSKNWRQMIYISKDSSAMVFSRQYPNNNKELADSIRNLMEEQTSTFFGGSRKWKKYNHFKKANLDVRGTSLLYNDVTSGYEHVAVRAKDDINFAKSEVINIGESNVSSVSGKGTLERGSRIWQN